MYLSLALCAYGVRASAKLVGFAFAVPSSTGVRIGPFVAKDLSVACDLLDAVLSNLPATASVTIGVPGINRVALELMESRGFVPTSSSLRMHHGEHVGECDGETIFGIINGAIG